MGDTRRYTLGLRSSRSGSVFRHRAVWRPRSAPARTLVGCPACLCSEESLNIPRIAFPTTPRRSFIGCSQNGQTGSATFTREAHVSIHELTLYRFSPGAETSAVRLSPSARSINSIGFPAANFFASAEK